MQKMRPFCPYSFFAVLITVKNIATVILCVFFSVTIAGTAFAQANDVIFAKEVRIAGNAERTRFIVDLSASVQFAAFTLANPYRVVIDIPEVDFASVKDMPRSGRGLIATYRFGLITKGKSRLVLDLAEPAVIDQAFVLEAIEDQPARLVFDLVQASRNNFLETVGKLKSVGTLEESKPAATVPVPKGRGKIVIILDPGHGGIDDGALGTGNIKEKDIVLNFAKALRKALGEIEEFEVYLTREEDNFISLADRVEFARRKGAALMVSIHADIVKQEYVRGATIYTLSEQASDEVAATLAEKENRSDVIAGVELADKPDEVANILIDLARRETKNFSVSFARSLLEGIRPQMRLNKNPLRSGGFLILKAPDVPSVLVELGYLSNTHDEELLTREDWQQKTAQRFALAIQSFFSKNAEIRK